MVAKKKATKKKATKKKAAKKKAAKKKAKKLSGTELAFWTSIATMTPRRATIQLERTED